MTFLAWWKLFVFFKSIVGHSGESNFLVVMVKEVAGALVVALAVSFVLGQLIKLTREPVRQILISVLDVALVYAVCEHLASQGLSHPWSAACILPM